MTVLTSPTETNPSFNRRAYLRGIAGTAALSFVPGVASAQEYAPLGRVAVDGAKEAVVGKNDIVYVATTDGFAVVDVSDPAAPSVIAEQRDILAEEPDGPLTSIADVKVEGDRLLVASPAYPESEDYFGAVAVYDVSDPADPSLLTWKPTELYHHNVFIHDGTAYLTGNGIQGKPLVMLDVETLEELGRWSPVDATSAWNQVNPGLWSLHDLWIQDGVAYLAYWDGGTWILDVSDPTQPTPITTVRGRPPSELSEISEDETTSETLEPPGNHHSVTVNADASLLAIGTESWDIPPSDPEAGPGFVELFDITDPKQPESLSRIEPPSISGDTDSRSSRWTTAHNFDLVGDRLYTSWYGGGVRLFDVSDPANPNELRAWRAKTASFWTAQAVRPGEFYIGSSWRDPTMDESSGAGKKKGARLYTFPEPALQNPTKTPGASTTTSLPTTGNPSENGTDLTGPGLVVAAAVLALGAGVCGYFRQK